MAADLAILGRGRDLQDEGRDGKGIEAGAQIEAEIGVVEIASGFPGEQVIDDLIPLRGIGLTFQNVGQRPRVETCVLDIAKGFDPLAQSRRAVPVCAQSVARHGSDQGVASLLIGNEAMGLACKDQRLRIARMGEQAPILFPV